MVRILIVDDSSAVRRALRTCLELTPNWEVCGEAASGQSGIDMVRDSKPDVVLLDYAMPGMNGLEAARQIAKDSPNSVMFLFTMFAPEQLAQLAQSAGVQEVISKAVGGVDAIVHAIKDATARREFGGQERFPAAGEVVS